MDQLCGALEALHGAALGSHSLFDLIDQGHEILPKPAGKQINGTVAVLGPDVQAGMGFCEKQEASKSVRAEFVTALFHYCQPAVMNCLGKESI